MKSFILTIVGGLIVIMTALSTLWSATPAPVEKQLEGFLVVKTAGAERPPFCNITAVVYKGSSDVLLRSQHDDALRDTLERRFPSPAELILLDAARKDRIANGDCK